MALGTRAALTAALGARAALTECDQDLARLRAPSPADLTPPPPPPPPPPSPSRAAPPRAGGTAPPGRRGAAHDETVEEVEPLRLGGRALRPRLRLRDVSERPGSLAEIDDRLAAAPGSGDGGDGRLAERLLQRVELLRH